MGESPALREAREQIASFAALCRDSEPPTVLILGETGTGKDVAARFLHLSGPYRGEPLVQVDCAALPRELIEAELFGHEKGAYTGAHGPRPGLIEAAEAGTLFLDEVAELPFELQAKLLNVIERRRTRRLGSIRERQVKARFVAASNRNLPELIAQGRFRADLYYRLNVMTVTLPPLRARGEDIVLLARHYACQTSLRYRLPEPTFDPEIVAAMEAYPWPGNVRELKNLVERAVLVCQGRPIKKSDLALSEAGFGENLERALIGLTLKSAERLLITKALQATGYNVSEAARRLGVSRMTLRYRMQKYGLKES